MIYSCRLCGYYTNNKYSLQKHFKSKKHIYKLSNKWESIFYSYSRIKWLEMRMSQLVVLMRNSRIERCDISTQTDEVDFIYKHVDDFDYDGDIDMSYLVKKRKRRERFKNKNIIIKQKIIKREKERNLKVLNGCIICLCLLLIYISKNKSSNDVSLGSSINVEDIEKNKRIITSLKKPYVPAISFKKLWKEELSKYFEYLN